MRDPQGIARAHALARVLGALYTDGSSSCDAQEKTFHARLNLGHLIDAAQAKQDITLLVGKCGEVQKSRNFYKVRKSCRLG